MSNASKKAKPKAEPPNSIVQPVPWSPFWGVIFVAFVYYASQYLSAIAISFYPLIKGWTSQQTLVWFDISIAAKFAYLVIVALVSISAIYLFLKRYELNLSSIGLRRPRWKDAGYGLLWFPVYILVFLGSAVALSFLIPGLDVDQKQFLGFDNVQGASALILTFLSLVILPPLVEETMIRGFLYSTFKKALPLVGAVLATSLIFAVAHLSGGGPAGPLYIAAIDTFILSLFLIYLREKTDGLWASITLHALKNGLAFTILYILKWG